MQVFKSIVRYQWNPAKKLSRLRMDQLRQQHKEGVSLEELQATYKISQHSIKRILKSKFVPDASTVKRQETKRKESVLNRFNSVKAKQKL